MDSEALMSLIESDANIFAILEAIDSGSVTPSDLKSVVPEPNRFNESILSMIEFGLISPVTVMSRPTFAEVQSCGGEQGSMRRVPMQGAVTDGA